MPVNPLQKEQLQSYGHLYGLIGYPLSHSFSKKHFTEKFAREGIEDHAYELFPLESIADLPQLLKDYPNLRGLNVTIPYKEQVLPYLDELDSKAEAIGAVNTILIQNGRLKGFNTDLFGFYTSLHHLLDKHQQKVPGALILGTGGASKAIIQALKDSEIPYHLVSRSQGPGKLCYEDLAEKLLNNFPLIVNTTPLGMSPNVDSCPPIPYQYLNAQNTLFDLVYNPEKTLFLKKGIEAACLTINGLEMLHLQAEEAWRIWQEKPEF